MAIVEMKKFHLLALKSEKNELLRRLQIFRNVQFFENKDEELNEKLSKIDISEEFNELDTKINRCNYCIDLLAKYFPKKGGYSSLKEGLPDYTFKEMEDKANKINFDEIYEKIKISGDELEGVRFDISKAYEEINDLTVFSKLDIIPIELSELKNTSHFIGAIPIKSKAEFEGSLSEMETLYWELIGMKKDEAVYLLMCHSSETNKLEDILKAKGFSKINLDVKNKISDKISQLYEEIEKLKTRRTFILEEIEKSTEYRSDIELYYEYLSNIKVRLSSSEAWLSSEAACFIEGYYPLYQEDEFNQIVKEVTNGAYSLEIEDVSSDDKEVPIMLKNNKLFRVFEPVTATYAMPRYNEMDPTPFLAPFYALFFGMMSADAGYGILVFILCLLGLKLFKLKPAMKKNIKFFMIVSIFTVFWGLIYNSFFGYKIPFMPTVLDMGGQVMQILILSVVLGVVHLYTGLGLKAYMLIRDKKVLDAIFEVFGWYLALTGGILFIGGCAMKLPAIAIEISKWVMIVGMLMIVIGGARSAKEGGVGAKLGAGLYNLYGISGYVGDLVSYSRLMALGLAGAYIALSVNTISGMLFGSVFSFIFGLVIFVLFHAFNIFLAYLGAYVHGMRLIYVEFFGKFYEGGGKPFKYMRSTPKYINLDRHYEE